MVHIKKLLLFIIVLCSISAFAVNDEVKQLAHLLNTSNPDKTMMLIDFVVENKIDYSYNKHAQSISATWETMKGDCTDKAILKVFMARELNIMARTVHGYDEYGDKHDYYSYFNNGKWWIPEAGNKFVGYGIW